MFPVGVSPSSVTLFSPAPRWSIFFRPHNLAHTAPLDVSHCHSRTSVRILGLFRAGANRPRRSPPATRPTAYCLLSTAQCPLPTTHCPPPTTHCPPDHDQDQDQDQDQDGSAQCPLTTAHRPLTTDHRPLTTARRIAPPLLLLCDISVDSIWVGGPGESRTPVCSLFRANRVPRPPDRPPADARDVVIVTYSFEHPECVPRSHAPGPEAGKR